MEIYEGGTLLHTPYHSMGNGVIENFNKTIKQKKESMKKVAAGQNTNDVTEENLDWRR